MKTAAEGLKRLIDTKKVSRNVNYEAMRSLFSLPVCSHKEEIKQNSFPEDSSPQNPA